jgi:hypothetical protein
LVPYAFEDADNLLTNFFDAVEKACGREGVPFETVSEDTELEEADDDYE